MKIFRIINPATVASQDLTGSGIETIAHTNENKRIVILFCAFERPPKIVRLNGTGEIILPDDEKFPDLFKQFPNRIATRAIMVLHLTRIQDACGYGVPLYDFKQDWDVLAKWADVKGKEGVAKYRQIKNLKSIDGLSRLK